jgi:hypothetical protein
LQRQPSSGLRHPRFRRYAVGSMKQVLDAGSDWSLTVERRKKMAYHFFCGRVIAEARLQRFDIL